MGRGKVKKIEVNVTDGHGATPRLPPAPSTKDLSAVPNKLRRLMQLKQSTSLAGTASTRKGPRLSKREGSVVPGISPSINAVSGKVMGARKQSFNDRIELQYKSKPRASEGGETIPANQGQRKAGKRKRKGKDQEDLLALAEKFKAVPAREGLLPKRKRYLEDKKKKRKGQRLEDVQPLYEHEKIEFGDIVEAPPKLSFPSKAKQKMEALSQERKRLEAIEMYRAKRNWDFGAKLPVLQASHEQTS